ncbi:pilus assembly protein PilR [Salmonella enterica subsp. enterica]|uniref:type II secretion system F family protein n=1 Tax=Kosakonia radicincitans TaxID=283686 RepID=UPI000461A7BA|nr:type II secretion system F family protein [Kosakonia radicincitans]EBU5081928.1 pilus assembly protein PilR [Salmonella enterica]ECC3308691.1 pilus assembly protein PilR [Salmonella enterica subsp. enterica]EEJ9202699.1 pilus assembly protein PilR [Salmonella enterica subsp. enterica serovar Newport]EDR2818986.1 pilus assembly protein PilR [Salmonella enterica subsp. enterica]EJV0313783.1 type II secretion system F family protein [Salmonella enterica]
MSDNRFRPVRRMNLFQQLRYRFLRVSFTGKYRRPFYEMLRFLLENGKAEEEAFRMIGDVHTDFGRRWHPYAELVQDCLQALGDNRPGHQLLDVLACWVPREEAALLGAGLKSGALAVALEQSDRLIDVRRRIVQQVIFASTYPLLLVIIFSLMLAVNSFKLVPTLGKISDPASWTGALGMMYSLAGITDRWWIPALVSGIALLLLVIWSLPRWRGRIREMADTLMPWSLYRDMQGAVFLMNVAALLEAGLADIDVLQTLRKTAPPWLRERIDAALEGISLGNSLGMALRNSGYDFPDRQSVNYLSLLGNGKGASRLISKYADRALENIITRVKRRANTARGLSWLLILLFFVLMGSMAMQIQEMSRLPMH